MTNALEVRVSKMELFQQKLAQQDIAMNENLQEFSEILSEELRIQVKQEFQANMAGVKQEISTHDNKINKLEEVTKIIPIDRHWRGNLQKAKKRRMYSFTGSEHTPKYDLFFGKYMSYCGSEIKQIYGDLSSIEDLCISEYDSVIRFINNWTPTDFHNSKIINDWKTKDRVGKTNDYESKILKEYMVSNPQYK